MTGRYEAGNCARSEPLRGLDGVSLFSSALIWDIWEVRAPRATVSIVTDCMQDGQLKGYIKATEGDA